MFWLTVVITHSASAHATFEGSTPEPNARLASAPKEIILRFSEPVTPISVRLLNAHLEDAGAINNPEIDRTNLRLHVPTPLTEGRYLVTYRVISEDAHPVSGTIQFTVGANYPGGTALIQSPSDASPWTRIQGAAHILNLLALVLAAGYALFIAIFGRMAAQPTETAALRYGAIAIALAAGLGLTDFAVSGSAMIGGGWATIVKGMTWRVASESSLGRSALLALFGIFCVGLGLAKRRMGAASRAFLVAGALALAGSTTVTGHAAATSAPVMLAMFIHVLLAAFWAGALLPLWISLRDGSAAGTHRLIESFSRSAVMAVPLLVIVGGIMGWTHIRSIGALTHSEYGQLLLVKSVAVAFLLVLAAANKFWLTPMLAGDGGTSARRMRIVVGVEILAMVFVLTISATLSRTAPAQVSRSGEERIAAASGVLTGTLIEKNYRVVWQFRPANSNADDRQLTLRIERNHGIPVDALGVTASFALPAKGLEPLMVTAHRVGPGEYLATVSGVRETGRWSMVFEILLSDFDKLVLETVLVLP